MEHIGNQIKHVMDRKFDWFYKQIELALIAYKVHGEVYREMDIFHQIREAPNLFWGTLPLVHTIRDVFLAQRDLEMRMHENNTLQAMAKSLEVPIIYLERNDETNK